MIELIMSWMLNNDYLEILRAHVRILQKSQENGQNRTNTDTGTDRVHKSRKFLAKDKIGQLMIGSKEGTGSFGASNRLEDLESSFSCYKYKHPFTHKGASRSKKYGSKNRVLAGFGIGGKSEKEKVYKLGVSEGGEMIKVVSKSWSLSRKVGCGRDEKSLLGMISPSPLLFQVEREA
ncbi:hypothetical protein Tco_0921538 [Tanacetum coccineum]